MDAELGKAFDIAYTKHKDQRDKAGEPYILHLIRVMHSCQQRKAKITAMLHDIVEDTDVSLEWITSQFGLEISGAVNALTRRDEENYAGYLARVMENTIALEVKTADIADNMSWDRLALLPEAEAHRLYSKYCAAFLTITTNKL